MIDTEVTIIVVPRERFSLARQSLESIYQNTNFPFKLIYVDNNSPKAIRAYLETEAKTRGFQLLASNYYLSPNQARNLGLREVTTKYAAIVDNDVLFTPNWLSTLVQCAEETQATIVTPLICQNEPLHEIVHCAGGECKLVEKRNSQTGEVNRYILERILYQGKKVSSITKHLYRQPTGIAEFHCLLVRNSIFAKIGLLDEKLLATKEHFDFSLTVMQAGGTIYFEPAAVVTYLTQWPAPPLKWYDLHYYMLRWSDAWQLGSLKHLREKWQLSENGFFRVRYKKLGGKRYAELVKPLQQNLAFFGEEVASFGAKVFYRVEKLLNFYVTTSYNWSQNRSEKI